MDLSPATWRRLEASSHKDLSPSHSRESSLEAQPLIPTEVREREAYIELVNQGGRPLYSIHLIEDVAKDPLAYSEMLRTWLDLSSGSDLAEGFDWATFHHQLNDRQQFRHWQAHARGQKPPLPVEPYKKLYPVPLSPSCKREEQEENREEEAREMWQDGTSLEFDVFTQAFRRTSTTYTEAMGKLFAEYAFARPFQLHDDVAQQDELTTWAEYLGYQLAAHYRYKCLRARMQPRYDSAMHTLWDANVLRPFETESYICDIASSERRQSEQDRAEADVSFAKRATAATMIWHQKEIADTSGFRSTRISRVQLKDAAESHLVRAKESLELIKRRNHLVKKFRVETAGYRTTRNEARRPAFRILWALEQFRLIETQANLSRVRSRVRRDHACSQGERRRRSHVCISDDEPSPKRFKEEDQGLDSPAASQPL